eukprot:4499629-Amphidinium_carterae.1
MSFGTEGVKAWVSRVSKVGSSLNDSDSELLLRLSGDCTPVSLRSSHTHDSGKHTIKATGRETMELFVSQ